MSNAWWAYGSQFKIGAGEAFTTVAEVTDISGPNITRDSIEVTSYDSADGWRERLPGFRDGDSITVQANWLPNDVTQDGSTGLWAQFNDDENHNFQLVTPTAVGITISFTGHLTGFSLTLPLEEQGQVEFPIAISGKVTIAATA
jgi:predicted secreted protein